MKKSQSKSKSPAKKQPADSSMQASAKEDGEKKKLKRKSSMNLGQEAKEAMKKIEN